MPIDNLKVFYDQSYSTFVEVLTQQVDIFNSSSKNTIVLDSGKTIGDFNEEAFITELDIVKRRSPYVSGAIATKSLAHASTIDVKVAAGTFEIEINPSQFTWIGKNPEEAGVVIGQKLAIGMLADMLNTAIMALVAALGQVPEITHDGTAATVTPASFNNASRLFGDRYDKITAWVMHSKVFHDSIGNNIANANRLFEYGTVVVMSDVMGRPFIVTDSPALVDIDGVSAGVDKYTTLGLVPGAASVQRNDDFDDVLVNSTGSENIGRTYQAEWSMMLAIVGFAWDIANGGKAPNDAALATSSNWDKVISDNKNGPGVLLETR